VFSTEERKKHLGWCWGEEIIRKFKFSRTNPLSLSCSPIKVFTVTFDQFNAFLLYNIIIFLQVLTPMLTFIDVIYKHYDFFLRCFQRETRIISNACVRNSLLSLLISAAFVPNSRESICLLN